MAGLVLCGLSVHTAEFSRVAIITSGYNYWWYWVLLNIVKWFDRYNNEFVVGKEFPVGKEFSVGKEFPIECHS